MLTAMREKNKNGVYEIHTNSMHYPRNMQPTRVRFEQVADQETDASESRHFPPLEPAIARNFFVTDTYMEAPPAGISQNSYDVPFRNAPADYEAYAQADFLAPFQGLGAVSQDIRDELPEECRIAFDQALKTENHWHSQWGTESASTSRREPVVDKAIVPYSMIVV